MRLAHQNHLGVGRQAHQAAERAQRFGDALVRLQKSEDADQRRGLVQPQLVAVAVAVGLAESRRRAESRAIGPVKPAARISSCMKRLCTTTPRALSSMRRVMGTPS